MPFPEQMEIRQGVLMTVQNRIRFDVSVIVGHAGMMIEFPCHSQTEDEMHRDGPRTTRAFVQHVDEALQRYEVVREHGGPIARSVRRAVGMYLFSLDDGVSHEINFCQGPVSICGRTVCQTWRAQP